MITTQQHHEIKKLAKAGVQYHPKVLGGSVLKSAAEQSAALHSDILYRSSRDLQLDPRCSLSGSDYRLTHIELPEDEQQDIETSNQIRQLTGISCESVFFAARALVKSFGITLNPDIPRLTIFQTTPMDNLPFHVDGEEFEDFVPDESFLRSILHLRGDRHLSFAESETIKPVEISLDPGDAYSFNPELIGHAAKYSTESLALYVNN